MSAATARLKTAVLAVFLLFAAVLPGLSAEASTPKTAAEVELKSASLALELAASEPSEPSRFGFSRSLELLDLEARPGQFGLDGLGNERCERTYALNNPIRYTDPTGLAPTCDKDGCRETVDVVADNWEAYGHFRMFTMNAGQRSGGGDSLGRALLGSFTNNQLPAMFQTRADNACAEEDYLACSIDLIGANALPRDGSDFLLFGLSLFAPETKLVPGRITGYTKHGIDQAIGRDGVGVATRAILDTVKNPTATIGQARGAIQYVGREAVVVLNSAGKVTTTWATKSSAWRIIP